MLEFTYIALIVVQFVIGPVIAFVPMSAALVWTLFAIQVAAVIYQNIQFPCVAFRMAGPALIGLTLASIYHTNIMTLLATLI